jgi:glycosyltransferase involved in cell wall biosynthesis
VTASVIVCTYNRADSLKDTLDSLVRQRVPDDVSWNVIVVDNNSTDHTQEMVSRYRDNGCVGIRYVFEGRQGLSQARNTGISEADSEYVLFTDDDVVVAEDWVAQAIAAFRETDADIVGGRVLPLWQTQPPKWLTEKLYVYLALLDYGDTGCYLERRVFNGANMAFNSMTLMKSSLFNILLGRNSDKLYSGEEGELMCAIRNSGGTLYYAPQLVVYHKVPRERMEKAYFIRWVQDQAELEARLSGASGTFPLLSVPPGRLLDLLKRSMVYLKCLFTDRNNVFAAEVRIRRQLSYIVHRIRLG